MAWYGVFHRQMEGAMEEEHCSRTVSPALEMMWGGCGDTVRLAPRTACNKAMVNMGNSKHILFCADINLRFVL